jgi:murein DD-endopeptidase MepM/ murein hydrolase activator NlpD
MGRQRPEGRRPDELTDAQKRALKRAEKLGLGSSRTAHRLLIKPPNPEWVKAAARRTDEGPLQTLTPPVEDPTILRGWGSGPGGYHLAVDVGGKPGTEVQAAAPGMVAYAGSQVRGYGNAVIVVHANGWVTWYTHNRQNLVVPGQSVKAGEPIARMGQTGYAHGAHLHFMLVYEGEHCDPMPLLRTDAPLEDRSGDPVEVDPARWQDERPDGVRCLPKSARPHPGRAKRRRGR